jgi:hypothetical protein
MDITLTAADQHVTILHRLMFAAHGASFRQFRPPAGAWMNDLIITTEV